MRVLAITHGPSVGAGAFGPVVERLGHRLEEWCVPVSPASPPAGADAVVIFGGGMHPDQEELHDWLLPELDLIRSLLEDGTPVLGVCLGAQLVARAGGGRAYRASRPEVGWLEVRLNEAGCGDPVLSALPPAFAAFQWHHYTVEPPAGSVPLGESDVCLQAYRLGEAVWGVQFHPEVTAAQIERWIAEDPDDVADAAALRAETRARIGRWNELGRELCAAFLRAAGPG